MQHFFAILIFVKKNENKSRFTIPESDKLAKFNLLLDGNSRDAVRENQSESSRSLVSSSFPSGEYVKE